MSVKYSGAGLILPVQVIRVQCGPAGSFLYFHKEIKGFTKLETCFKVFLFCVEQSKWGLIGLCMFEWSSQSSSLD